MAGMLELREREWDVFISHASEDKQDVVEPMARALQRRGLKVWYDRWVLKIGDSLRHHIDDGLASSRYGIVILSATFLRKKPWTERELDGLVQKEVNGKKVILPVWHGVTREDIAKYSLPLADKVAGNTSDGIETLADRLAEAVGGGPVLPAPSESTATAPEAAEEKWVDFKYPEDSGLMERLKAEGYEVRWCQEPGVARAVDLQGWEMAYENVSDGRRAVLRCRDRSYPQTLIKRRR
jgi:hypothetical protein